MIPHYDDAGRMDGDPEDIRFNVVPRRNITTEEVVLELLEMDRLGLISWYVVDGRPYVQLDPESWELHQSFHGVKRVDSRLPAFDSEHHKKFNETGLMESCTMDGVQVHQARWTDTPGTVDLSTKVGAKLREEKLRCSKEQGSNPAYSKQQSQHYSTQLGEHGQKLAEILKRFENGRSGEFNAYAFVQKAVGQIKAHPGALIKVLEGLDRNFDSIEKPWAWAMSALKVEDGNFHEQDFRAEAEEFKAKWKEWCESDEAREILSHWSRAP
jgi:hypothetical protein